jgi:hypothetical protein
LNNEADLLVEIDSNPEALCQSIRSDMRMKLMQSPASYDNFTEEDINNASKLSNNTILEKIRILLISTKTGQDRLKKRVESLFSHDTFHDATPDGRRNRDDLNAWIGKQNEKDIEKYLRRPGFLRRVL